MLFHGTELNYIYTESQCNIYTIAALRYDKDNIIKLAKETLASERINCRDKERTYFLTTVLVVNYEGEFILYQNAKLKTTERI